MQRAASHVPHACPHGSTTTVSGATTSAATPQARASTGWAPCAQVAATLADPRWALLVARSSAAYGQFWYSVQSTGVYCRPGCAARTPRPENVRFHASCAQAEQAGFRPCQRCRPRQPPVAGAQHGALVAEVCRIIERSAGSSPTRAALAQQTGLSASHLQRVFRQATGLRA